MAPSSGSKSSSTSKPSSSKKPSKHDSDSDDEYQSSSRKSSKKPDKKEKTSLLKSIFTKDRSEAQEILESKYFKDESSKAGKSDRLDSAMFKDESRVPSSKKEKKDKSARLDSAMFRDESVAYKSEKKEKEKSEKNKKVETVKEEEEYTEEPDFSQFVSKYELPEKVKKAEKKPEKKVEKKVEKSVKPQAPKPRHQSVQVEPSVRYESNKVESKVKSVANFKTAFKDDHDIEMAAKQTRIAELTGEELIEQEKWAFEKLKAHAGSCPMGFSWNRYTQEACGEQERLDGYRCAGGGHFVSHEMVAEGEGRTMRATDEFTRWEFQVSSAQLIGSHRPMPPPYTGLRWEPENRFLGSGTLPFSNLPPRFGPSNSPFARAPFGGGGSGGMANSPNSVHDPFGRFNPHGGGTNISRHQQQQPGGSPHRISVLDPNYNPGQTNEDDQQQQQPGGHGGIWGDGGNGGLYGRGYNGGGGGAGWR
ncbi:hypothetical protein ONS96_000619 [Cadophora gregata f. sp. sojae]|nr:hypothetical protein ONS96_000619 [Cadophora gregata f. sp. sojae]